MQHLYKNFLSDALIYAENQQFWKNIIVDMLGENGVTYPYYNENFANGKAFLDGNPIFSARSNQNGKIVRIIQEEAENSTPQINLWQENVEVENGVADELVICLELSDVTEIMARMLIKSWLVDGKTIEQIKNELSNHQA